MYFNNVPYGGPCWGISCASQMYFGKDPKDLSLAEASYLAGLPASPTEYSPYGAHPEKAKERQREVLTRMVEERYIDEDKAKEALSQVINIKPNTTPIIAPHFVMYVKSLLSQKYGEKVVSQGGLKVITTLDSDIQELAEKKVKSNVEKLANLQVTNGAAMVTDAKTGQILAMVGSKDYWDPKDGNYNMTLSLRPPGSSIKPVTYITGFKQGFLPGTVLLDVPTSFPDGTNAPYRPVNYDGAFHGAVTIRTALGSSYNVPAVKMLSMVGMSDFVEVARDMGITTWENPENYGLSATLGGAPVTMVDMMTVYGTLASNGVRHTATPILKVTDSKGKILEEYKDQGKPVLTPEIVYMISNILSDNKARTPAFGPNSQLVIPGHIVAVKTGTSDRKKDNWALGYNPEFVVGTWVGNFDNSDMNPALTSGITGATPIWHEIMAELLDGRENLAFQRPAGIQEANVDGSRDLAISGKTPKTVTALRREKKKEGETEKEVVSYSDPFGNFTADSNLQNKPAN
jgi:membrane peptidoglycan carboxypeptidase